MNRKFFIEARETSGFSPGWDPAGQRGGVQAPSRPSLTRAFRPGLIPISAVTLILIFSPKHGLAASDDKCISTGIVSHPILDLAKQYSTILAAGSSTFVSAAATYPLNLMKSRKQTGASETGNLYKGFTPFSFALCTHLGANLVCYDALREQDFSPGEAGAISGAVAATAVNPGWVYQIKASLAGNGAGNGTGVGTGNGTGSGATAGITGESGSAIKTGMPEGASPAIGRDEGKSNYLVKDFLKEVKKDPSIAFRGQALTLMRMIPNAAYFSLYETLNQGIQQELKKNLDEDSSISPEYVSEAVAGGTARCIFQALTHPVDTIGVIRQSTGQSYSEIIKNISKEGTKGFFRGVGFATATGSIGTAIYTCLFKYAKDQLSGEDHH